MNIVKDIIERGEFEPSNYKATGPKEAHNVNHFIKLTKPLIPSGLAFTSNSADAHQLRHRYQILVDELSAGNSGELLKEEMIEILRNFELMKLLGRAKSMQLIKGLKDV